MLKSLTDISKEDIEQIEALAALFFTPREIALMLEIKVQDFFDELLDEESSIFRAFNVGRLQSEADLRKSIVKLAKSGSSPAQTMSLDLLYKSKAGMLDR